MRNKSLLGIIGGMGTQATASFYEKLHSFQTVTAEQEYIDLLLYSIPSIPDRTAFILGQSVDSPLDKLVETIHLMETANVSCIAIPCATSHYFYDKLVQATSVPIINMLDETAKYAADCGVKKVCLLATDGTIKGRVFSSAFEKYNIDVSVPPNPVQLKIMKIIYDIKRGATATPGAIEAISEQSLTDGVQAVVLGCTELCIHAKQSQNVINILDVLANAAIARIRGLKI